LLLHPAMMPACDLHPAGRDQGRRRQMSSDRQDALLAEVARVKRALGMALAELCRINAGCPSDVNAEIWEAFEWTGGDGDGLSRQIDYISQMKKTIRSRPAAGGGE
jgi:hypothetical protein